MSQDLILHTEAGGYSIKVYGDREQVLNGQGNVNMVYQTPDGVMDNVTIPSGVYIAFTVGITSEWWSFASQSAIETMISTPRDERTIDELASEIDDETSVSKFG